MKVVIIGGVATGPKTAARLRRLQPEAEITVVEEGELISYGGCGLPLYLSNLVPQLDDLRTTAFGLVRDPLYFREHKDIEILNHTRVLAIEREKKEVLVRDLVTGQERRLPYDVLVLATGAQPVLPPLPGRDLRGVSVLHHPEDARQLKDGLRQRNVRRATVIGAGLIGLEAADALAAQRIQVSVCELQGQVLAKVFDRDMAKLLESHMVRRGIDLRLNCRVQALEGDEHGNICDVLTDQGRIETELVILATGVMPRVELAREAGLSLGVTGAIQVDSRQRTSDPWIYAGGDCAEQKHLLSGKPVYVPLASTGNKQGRIIADQIAGLEAVFQGVLGTSVLQAFEWNMGRTGLGEEEAKDSGFEIITGLINGHDATHYHPFHASLTLKLVADRSGRLLGAQVLGPGEGIKRLDVLTTLIQFGGSLEDVMGLDLGYAPPFATAMDVVIHAANTLENKRRQRVSGIQAQELRQRLGAEKGICLLDVREREEVENLPIKIQGVLWIPLGELRQRWREIPADAEVVAVCERGIRGYEAACFLQSRGFSEPAYLEGGMAVWAAYQE